MTGMLDDLTGMQGQKVLEQCTGDFGNISEDFDRIIDLFHEGSYDSIVEAIAEVANLLEDLKEDAE